MSITTNRFKSTIVGGSFSNIDNGSDLAEGYFKRNLTVDGNIICTSGNIINTNLDNQLLLKADITYVNDQIALIDAPEINEQLSLKADITYVDSAITTVNANLATKANLASPTFTGTVSGITKTMVGLGNVDNTSDVNKPVSTAQQTALNLKANLASPTFTGTVSGITKTMVGLSNVDNTSDVNKPVSTAQQTALDLKPNATGGTLYGAVARYLYLYNMGGSSPSFAGNTFGTVCSNFSSGQGEVDIISSGYSYPNGSCCIWYTLDTSNAPVSLMTLRKSGNLIVTGDISSPTITTINSNITTKAPINNPTFTGTVTGITKTMVGLSNVDNTSDENKPISTATQTALNSKANSVNPTFTGTSTFTNLQINNKLMLGSSVGRICRASFQLRCTAGAYYLPYVSNMLPIPDKTINADNSHYLNKIGTGNVEFIIDKTASDPALNNTYFAVHCSGSFDNDITGNNNILVGVAQKNAYVKSGNLIGYSFTLIITRSSAPGTRADITDNGVIDCSIFW